MSLSVTTDAEALEGALALDTIEPFEVGTISLMLKGRLIPAQEKEFLYKAYLINAETGDTITSIPVGGTVRQ